jgi:Methylamine utilisation protein MauE
VALVVTGFRFGLAVVFLLASVPKLFARADFETAVGNYGLLPRRAVRPAAQSLPLLELGGAIALLVGVAVPLVALLVGLLLVLFVAAIVWKLLRGHVIECGCAGAASPRRISWRLVIRDAVLAGLAFTIAGAPPQTFGLHVPWPFVGGSISGSEVFAVALAATALAEMLTVEILRVRGAVFRLTALQRDGVA